MYAKENKSNIMDIHLNLYKGGDCYRIFKYRRGY